jgi:hypothetical protein
MTLAKLILLILSPVVGGIAYVAVRRWRINRCEACRLDEDRIGEKTRVLIAHTCSKRRALYRDRGGNVVEFGSVVRRGVS